ncbi:23S rRNA (uracil(747)-C(5))-methyltransferase RlmC [Rodentibacter trehalosifermentans]|uniref:23S rRNA (uracil(747)-C(5))-methyltransferase RlmC n=1 Tax=Rodentibacter trehalosifermentans TaxID=1908263 RepID=A0A1V3J1T4_9PAST|nr:23S rRNA (uracil(747)-C(5))-methyltransferase RlmC [Rodentibacter trehalosifermentans]OOF45024.1 23S rRNA (uracil(747)-C(5))-methyltransferase [Rodentibacter trehalosifermentans]OOF48575.1 23S rRNA (uracil(747)-C(5))-methyltransferase [Rodentibacter trehalosifermentans]OOF51106.1 23S rRNA (uracil(747)-C(5))-methyltransferase [Rodentibacter trehalosifermentans]
MICHHYQKGDCRSCQWLEKPYEQQLAEKITHLKHQLSHLNCEKLVWFSPFQSTQTEFRNKAKMAVSGAVERPIFAHPQGAVDLCDCPLYPTSFKRIFPIIKDFIGRAGLVPYNIEKRKGELKYIFLTESHATGKLMLRVVLRSESKLPLIRRELDGLLARLPQLEVVSVNLQPQHAAILEGEEEIFLTKQQYLPENFNNVPLFIRPQGFFQTNPNVAAGLYATAQEWVKHLPISKLWDLFCGVGGFGLHCAKILKQTQSQPIALTGIEISPSAILAAQKSAQTLGIEQVEFQSLDAANFALNQTGNHPDLAIVNPPRRGIGQKLSEFLNEMQPRFILYSSCNAVSMGEDLRYLTHYKATKIQLFDMFPNTAHYEVLVLLEAHQG